MKVKISWDERYPNYEIAADNDEFFKTEIELTSDDVEAFKRVRAAYDEWQEKLRLLVDEAQEPKGEYVPPL